MKTKDKIKNFLEENDLEIRIISFILFVLACNLFYILLTN